MKIDAQQIDQRFSSICGRHVPRLNRVHLPPEKHVTQTWPVVSNRQQCNIYVTSKGQRTSLMSNAKGGQSQSSEKNICGSERAHPRLLTVQYSYCTKFKTRPIDMQTALVRFSSAQKKFLCKTNQLVDARTHTHTHGDWRICGKI